MEWLQFVPFNDITVNLIILCGGYLVFTRKVIWHKDYDVVVKEKNEWKSLALRLLESGEKLASQNEIIAKQVGSEGDGLNVVP